MNQPQENTKSNLSENDEDMSFPKNKTKTRAKKRKRESSGSSTDFDDILPENTLEVEKNLQIAAMKNNLDEASVKKILKKVVTNDHVLALVKLQEEAEASAMEDKTLQPKLTRAKAKELMKASSKSAPWNLELTPIKHIPVKTRPEVKALIAQELPEDEDDDEYEPTHEESDDDQTLESCSDLESQPKTPATPSSQYTISPKVVKDGPFKVPQDISTSVRRKLVIDEEEATIALRTRSKLSLSETPIEHIESSFVPPDELPTPAVDDLWNQFLNECLNPASVTRHEEDDEADPEYNVAADPDAHDEDEDALESSLNRISKKELNDLVTELFNIMPDGAASEELAENLATSVLTDSRQSEDLHLSGPWEGKQEPLSDEEVQILQEAERISFERQQNARTSIGKNEMEDAAYNIQKTKTTVVTKGKETTNASVGKENKGQNNVSNSAKPTSVKVAVQEQEVTINVREAPRRVPPPSVLHCLEPEPQEVTVVIDKAENILPEQIQILQQQLRQHVQLATSNFLQLYINPTHWELAPKYKEYLESLDKLVQDNPRSVANVCNLKPAIELVNSWKKAVSVVSPDNVEMVDFVKAESERSRRRCQSNNLYVGEFHNRYMEVIANSTVFLYPYLLPSMPYRADPTRKFGYRRCEDELIALGLDQFWQYVEDNPDLYQRQGNPNPRTRWGLAAAVSLVCKHMFPWLPPKVILRHIHRIRSGDDKDNPLWRFFKNREIKPVQHRLLPVNPSITLYEQPEHEIPRIWLRYLAKSSKRFRNYLYKRKHSGALPHGGVEVDLGKSVELPSKAPLPIDFTKTIVSNRANVKPKEIPTPTFDKFDIQIVNPTTTQKESTENNTLPVLSLDASQSTQFGLSQNVFRVVETSTGAFLVPLTVVQTTNTVNSFNGPITSAVENKPTKPHITIDTGRILNKDKDIEHCECCLLLKKIRKQQKLITDYFKPKFSVQKCDCTDRKYPKFSKKLRLLLDCFKSKSWSVHRELKMRLKEIEKTGNNNKEEIQKNDYNIKDLVSVATFKLKLLTRLGVVRNTYVKKTINALFSKFDPISQDPIYLSEQFFKICEMELVDISKEFTGFLTAEQADRVNNFKDYFLSNCADDVIEKIDEHIQDAPTRYSVLSLLNELCLDNISNSCEMCFSLLDSISEYPKLAEYIFTLFPHKATVKPRVKRQSYKPRNDNTITPTTSQVNPVEANVEEQPESQLTICEDTPMESEEQGTGCGEGNGNDAETIETGTRETPRIPPVITPAEETTSQVQTPISQTLEWPQPIRKTEIIDYSSTDLSIVVLTDEPVKAEEPEWKRDEDKLILEVLLQYLTPEERRINTILELLEENNVPESLCDSLTHKSIQCIRDRMAYLLNVLVESDKQCAK